MSSGDRLLVFSVPESVDPDDLDKLALSFLADAMLEGFDLTGYSVVPDGVVITRAEAREAAECIRELTARRMGELADGVVARAEAGRHAA